MNLKEYQLFINEQRHFFDENIKPHFNNTWESSVWIGGTLGSGWLLSRSGNTKFLFSEISKFKEIAAIPTVNSNYQEFMKAVMVLSFRKANSKASPQKLYSEFLVLKRWYSELYNINPDNPHPCLLSTAILNQSFEILIKTTNKNSLPDHAGTYLRLQQLLNQYGFTSQLLDFSKKYLYINRQNRTPKAKRTNALLEQLELNEDDLNKDKLISIQTFMNIVSLISLCKSDGEKILLNLLLLLIITGMRFTEVILLKKDDLIKRPLLDPITNEHLSIDGKKQYTFGIKYYGAKGSGLRVHWVEPSTSIIIEAIFSNVISITKPYRDFLVYIRNKNIIDFLPQSIDNIEGNLIELDDLTKYYFGFNEDLRSTISSKRESIIRNAEWTSLKPKLIEKSGKSTKRYYTKEDLNNYILSQNIYHNDHPINHKFNYEGKLVDIPFEELLFIHEFRSTNIQRSLYHKNIVIPINMQAIRGFLGKSRNKSIFEKYNLLEKPGKYSEISTHIPRHNINTFLALAGLSEHLQAMLMGRVDIKQNQYYQHLALKQYRLATSILDKNEVSIDNVTINISKSPINSIKDDGLMYFSDQLDLENNLKMNLQTFDSKKEVANYIKASFSDDYFKDIALSFNEISTDTPQSAEELLVRHSNLHPLPFGGCMRDISSHGCPKRLACQSGESCGNFALTGRKGELDFLQNLKNQLEVEYQELFSSISGEKEYMYMLEILKEKINNLNSIEVKAFDRLEKLIPICVFPYDNLVSPLPTTLAELFAIEQRKLELKET